MSLDKLFTAALLMICYFFLQGCASVPMASKDEDGLRKQFSPPTEGTSGVYIFRNSFLGAALKKSVFIDGQPVGETANKVYFYTELSPGEHTFSTESEFGENDLRVSTQSGRLYFIEQYIKMGVFAGGAGLKKVDDTQGQNMVRRCRLAQGGTVSSLPLAGTSREDPSSGYRMHSKSQSSEQADGDDNSHSKSVACDPKHRHLFFDCE